MRTFRDLSPLLNPRAIAVVGASERHGSAGCLVLENLRNLGYRGAVYAVHPKHKEVLGFPCYPDLKLLPGPVDSVAVLLGAEKALPILETAVEMGTRAAWVFASGFAEADPEGKALLQGFRGRSPADVDALADALVRLSQLAADLGDLIAALDINPLMVLPGEQGVRAVDVLVEVVS
jgi:predicted CoA-binding protein